MEEEGGYKKPKKKKIRVKCYFNATDFKAVAQDAEKVGKRRGGLLLFTQKPHGFSNETLANTDGISKFLKYTWQYWKEHEHERMEEAAELLRKEKEIAEQKKRLGMV